jgi:outer membrane lipoprotein-sorting protein
MTSRFRTDRRSGSPALLVAMMVALLALALAGFASAAPGLSLEALLAEIGGKPSQEVRFEEKKYLAVLDAPVESSGVLRYQAPGRLEKHTERPQAESMILDGDLVVLQRDGRKRSLPLAQIPGVAALVGGLRDTLAGDASALRDRFKVVVQGDERRWQIDLLPFDPASATLVSKITLIGSAGRLDEVQTLQADGDRSVMMLSPK